MPLKVTGKDRLYAKLKRLAPAAAGELATANLESAEEMVGLARSYVRVRSGKLRDSIVATPPGQSPPDYGQGARVVPPGAAMVTAGNAGVRYPHLVEFGHKGGYEVGGLFKGATHPGAPAQPYFFPAYRIVRRKHRRRAGKALKSSIRKVAKS